MRYIKILVLGLALFAFLRFTWSHLLTLLENKKLKSVIIKLFPALEFSIWIVYIIWSSSLLLDNFAAYGLVITFIIVVILAVLAWYLLRDFISGFILRAENGFEPGQVIKTDFAVGTIKKLGYRSIEIISSSGQYVKIPYTLLINTSLIRPQENSKWVENILNLEFSTELDAVKVKNMLKKRLLEMPWILSEESIKIEMNVHSRDNSVTNYYATIHFYSITPESALKTEESLKAFIKESI